MGKTFSVLKQEVYVTVTRRSFLFLAFGLPLLSGLILLGVSALNRNAPGAVSSIVSEQGSAATQVDGYVDTAGLIQTIPASIPSGSLKAYTDEAAAQAALGQNEIDGYYVIPPDYLSNGELTYVREEFNPLTAFGRAGQMEWVLQVNLLGGDEQLAGMVENPLSLQVEVLNPEQQRDEDNPLTFFVPYAVTMLFYMVILMSASFLLSSVTKEKENRVLEILMSSITPRQMLVGKIIGLGIAGLIQTGIWMGTAFLLLRLGGRTLQVPAEFQLPASLLFWGLIFFLLGYALYASLMAAVGALVPNLREASQATFVVILPMLVPLFFVSLLIDQPNGLLAMGLSFFPLTAPVTMMTRMAATTVPLWQPLLAIVLVALTVVVVVRAVAGMFRAQILLSGQPFNLKLLFNALLGRV